MDDYYDYDGYDPYVYGSWNDAGTNAYAPSYTFDDYGYQGYTPYGGTQYYDDGSYYNPYDNSYGYGSDYQQYWSDPYAGSSSNYYQDWYEPYDQYTPVEYYDDGSYYNPYDNSYGYTDSYSQYWSDPYANQYEGPDVPFNNWDQAAYDPYAYAGPDVPFNNWETTSVSSSRPGSTVINQPVSQPVGGLPSASAPAAAQPAAAKKPGLPPLSPGQPIDTGFGGQFPANIETGSRFTPIQMQPLSQGQFVTAAEGGHMGGGLGSIHPMGEPQFMSEGGMENRYVEGEGDGTSDDVPAMLATGEFVIPADVVANLGNGSNEAGAEILDEFLEVIRSHKRNADPEDLPPDSEGPLQYLAQAQTEVQDNG